MTHAHVLWVDLDTGHAGRAAACGGFSSRLAPSPAPHRRPPSRRWHQPGTVVLCLAPSDRELPCLLELCAGHPVLLCLEPAQGSPGRTGFFAAGWATMCCASLTALPTWGSWVQPAGGPAPGCKRPGQGQPLRSVDARIWQESLTLLQEQRATLQATLASMSQGIFKTAPDGRITVYNQRVLELLNLPESLMATRPTLADLTRVQAERGDFGEGYSLVDQRGHDYVAQGAVAAAPEVYWRTARDGRTLRAHHHAGRWQPGALPM